jgi:hypothetical protein
MAGMAGQTLKPPDDAPVQGVCQMLTAQCLAARSPGERACRSPALASGARAPQTDAPGLITGRELQPRVVVDFLADARLSIVHVVQNASCDGARDSLRIRATNTLPGRVIDARGLILW